MEWHLADGLIVGIAIPVALYLTARAVYIKYRLMMACAPAPDPIKDHFSRLKEILTIFLGQKKLFQDFQPGIMHAFIFWGFCALMLRSLTMFGMAFAGFDFYLPGLAPGTLAGKSYLLIRNAAGALVSLMVIFALVRRYVLKVPRLLNTPSALFILLMILGLMVSDALFDAVLHAGKVGPAAGLAGHAAFLFHCLGILGFLVYLPSGKHMHIITSIFNVYLRPRNRSGRLTKLPLEDESVEVFGTPVIDRLTWKEVLDLYTCTECGRCSDMCPASLTDKKLSPRDVANRQKHFLDEEAPRLLSGKKDGLSAILGFIGKRQSFAGGGGRPAKEMLPEVIAPEEVWACTTCQACEQACPLNISHVQRINSMRRSEVLMKGQFPGELKRVFKGLQTNTNPWGMGADKRMEWAKDMDVPVLGTPLDGHPSGGARVPPPKENQGVEYLLYLGCNATFNERAQKVSQSLIRFLNKHGISFGVLGEREICCGETARRLGEEALGQTLIDNNIQLFNKFKVKKILTTCPHCYNVFKNEYPDFGGRYEVIHHSQLISELIRDGRVRSDREVKGRTVIHDSCYLGRVNNIYDPPRDILSSIAGLELVEHKRSREHGFCCGAGGGRFWLEEKEPRINHERVRQLSGTGAEIVATSCPYCLKMLDDGIKDLKCENIKVLDLIEILEL